MKKQQGFVLIFTVILLFVAAILGLYAMRSTVMQDKMTANINNKTITSNAAEDGASAFLTWAKTRFTNNGWPTSTTDKSAWTSSIPSSNTGTLEANSGTNGYYWINPSANIAGCATANTNPCWDETNKQVTALITANLIKTSGSSTSILGESQYRIKVAAPGGLKLPQLPAPLTLAGNINSFSSATSNNFAVIGGSNKVSIATTNSSSNQKVINELTRHDNNGNKKSENYSGSCSSTPCVSYTEDLGIWGNAVQLMSYINSIKNNSNVNYISGSATNAQLDLSKPVNIITGNLTQNGNLSDYTGVIIVLGATSSTINGGGNTKIVGGMYFANVLSANGSYNFGDVGLTINGGGNMNIKYDNTYFGGSSDITGAGTATTTTVLAWNDVL
ncbi:pilus assembly PilX family protein [Acinetobacter brisouii]